MAETMHPSEHRVDDLVRNLVPYDMPHVAPGERSIAIRLVTDFHDSLLEAVTPDALANAARIIDEDWRQRGIHGERGD